MIDNLFTERILEDIDELIRRGKSKDEILEICDIPLYNVSQYYPEIYDYVNDYIKKMESKIIKYKPQKINAKKFSIKKMAKETIDFDRVIERENEQWNKERKEIKYLNVKKKKTKIIDLKAYYIIDKTGQSILSEIKLKDEELLTPQIKRKVIKDLTEKLDSHIKAKKRESDIRKMSGGAVKSRQRMVKIDSESDSDY
jgi:hypothetical protein